MRSAFPNWVLPYEKAIGFPVNNPSEVAFVPSILERVSLAGGGLPCPRS